MNKMGFGFLRIPKKDDHTYDYDKLNKMVDMYMEKGGYYFDTCYTYLNGKSEEAIRKCVVERKERSSYMLANKLPGYMFKSYDDCQKYYEEELRRCGVDYFDVLMLHWLNDKHYEIAQKYHEFDFLVDKKSKGEVKYIGFSFHGDALLLDQILTEHSEVDIVLLQINYLDWNSEGIQSKKCYDVCVKHNKKVYVMEPVKGGTLAKLPKQASDLLKSYHPLWSETRWALAFVQSLPQVEICLSGMNEVIHIEENMQDIDPLTDEEIDILMKASALIHQDTAVACTACEYCLNHCPKHIPIPSIFKLYNEYERNPDDDWKIIPSYNQLTINGGKASQCINCHGCEKHCPQSLKIPNYMKEISKVME